MKFTEERSTVWPLIGVLVALLLLVIVSPVSSVSAQESATIVTLRVEGMT